MTQGICHKQFRSSIIQPALKNMNMYSADDEELLILTMATETLGGYYLFQHGGPALGIFQMEPATHEDIWRNYIAERPILLRQMQTLFSPGKPRPIPSTMVSDLNYATVMARLFYERVKENIPSKSDMEYQALFYKRYWNTSLGAADVKTVLQNYYRYIST